MIDSSVASKPRRLLRASERRKIVLDSAGRLFAEGGYEATRLDDIAAAAGVTKPILYRFFDSKTALYLGVLARHRDAMEAFLEQVPTSGPPRERLRSLLEGWYGYVKAHQYVCRMLFLDSGGGAEIEAFRKDVALRARVVLAEIVGALGGDASPALIEFMASGMAGLAVWWLDHPDLEQQTIVDQTMRLWSSLLVEAEPHQR